MSTAIDLSKIQFEGMSRNDLVQWLRNEKPETVVRNTISALSSGISIDDLWAALVSVFKV